MLKAIRNWMAQNETARLSARIERTRELIAELDELKRQPLPGLR